MSETTNLQLKKHDNPTTNTNEFDIENYLNNNWDKLDTAYGNLDNNKVDKVESKDLSSNDFTNEYKQKLDELENYDDTAIKEDIEDLQNAEAEQVKKIEALQKENAEQEAEIKRLREDLKGFPSSTVEGEYITLNDSADSRFNEFKIKGNSKQKTRSGKNKLYLADVEETTNTHGITYSVKDGVITLNGTSTTPHYINFKQDSRFSLSAGTYTISTKVISGSRNESPSGKQLNTTENQLLFNGGYMEETVTNQIEGDNIEAYLSLYISGVGVFNNFKIAIQLEEGSVATEIEQYGASPSTKFPSKIQNVEGDFEINITNKNIFNCNKWLKMTQTSGYPNIVSDSDNNIEIIEETINSIKYNQKGAYYGIISEYIKVKKGETFTLSFDYSNINRLFITQYDTSKVRLKTLNTTTILDSTTFTVEENGFITIGFSYSASTPNQNIIEIKNIQLEFGNIKTDYIEYEGKKYTFPLEEGQVLAEGDYPARYGIHHKKRQIELDGTENWLLNPNALEKEINTISFLLPIDNLIQDLNKVTCMSNYFRGYIIENVWNVDIEAVWNSNSNIYIRINRNILKTENLDGFKNWLAQQKTNGTPVIVEYELATEEVEPYTDEQQAVYDEIVKTVKSYKTVTNIFSTNEVSPKFEVNYRQDIKALINSTNKAVLNNA